MDGGAIPVPKIVWACFSISSERTTSSANLFK